VNVELPASGIEGALKSSSSTPDPKSARRGRALQLARTDREAA
jgi:hypothetical protein